MVRTKAALGVIAAVALSVFRSGSGTDVDMCMSENLTSLFESDHCSSGKGGGVSFLIRLGEPGFYKTTLNSVSVKVHFMNPGEGYAIINIYALHGSRPFKDVIQLTSLNVFSDIWNSTQSKKKKISSF